MQQLAMALVRVLGDFPAATRGQRVTPSTALELLAERLADGRATGRRFAEIDHAAVLPQREHPGGVRRSRDQRLGEGQTANLDRHDAPRFPKRMLRRFQPVLLLQRGSRLWARWNSRSRSASRWGGWAEISPAWCVARAVRPWVPPMCCCRQDWMVALSPRAWP